MIHYSTFGKGPALLIALHGFGDHSGFFSKLGDDFLEQYTVVAPDLPFHGKTTWDKSSFDQQDLLRIIEEIRRTRGQERFSLLGFSFGARLALAMLPALAPQLDRLYLMAPAGKGTLGLDLADRVPSFLRKASRWLIQYPGFLLGCGRLLQRMGLLHMVSFQFLERNLRRPERAKRAVNCWISMQYFKLNASQIKPLLHQYPIETTVFAGRRDPLIDKGKFEIFYQNWPKTKVIWEEKGHE
ncbi:MAG: alpha/beta fold hydrolase [Saprospiraceae bacterium]|nr:alpha/beta fold hydrolase [Saprospiraceae bacterium]